MAFKYADRVRETSTSTGTGTFSLAGAVTGFQTFSTGIGASNTCMYTISHRTAAEWEVGYGTLDALGTTLTRTSVQSSSNSNSAVTFSAGTKDVFVTAPAQIIPANDLVAGGRLTIQSLNPWQNSIVSGSTLRYTPATSSTIHLWTGNYWAPYTITSELTITNATTAANQNYDVSINWNSGSPTLVLTAWSTHTAGGSTRATAITYQNQVPMIGNNRYIGTVRMDATNAFADWYEQRYVWNAYNRIRKFLYRDSGVATYTLSSTTFRYANASAANIVSWITGIDGASAINCYLYSGGTSPGAQTLIISAIAMNAVDTVGPVYGYSMPSFVYNLTNTQNYMIGSFIGGLEAGYNFGAWRERVVAATTITMYGTGRAGIVGEIEC